MSTFLKELGSMSPLLARLHLVNLLNPMEGSAKIISLIARDENQHLAITQNILNKWKSGDDPEMKQIAKEEEEWTYGMFKRVVEEESLGQNYSLKDGSMIGLNDKLWYQYIEWIANRRMKSIGLKPIYSIPAKNNPLSMDRALDFFSKGLQVAPQGKQRSKLCRRRNQTRCQERLLRRVQTLN